MAKTILLGKTPYRVLRQYRVSFSLQPLSSEYPHSILLRDPPYATKVAPVKERWGHVTGGRDREAKWYRRISDAVFEELPRLEDSPRSLPAQARSHATKKSPQARGTPAILTAAPYVAALLHALDTSKDPDELLAAVRAGRKHKAAMLRLIRKRIPQYPGGHVDSSGEYDETAYELTNLLAEAKPIVARIKRRRRKAKTLTPAR